MIKMFKLKIEKSPEEMSYEKAIEKKKRKCNFCKNLFLPKVNFQIYCSKECAEKSRKKYMRIYMMGKRLSLDKSVIKNLEELAKRQQFEDEIPVIKSSCIACGSTEDLVEHHIRYLPEEKVILCNKCHLFLHKVILNGQRCRPRN